jgi:branched-chain amino acid transport system ATP-binding protein
LLEHLLGDLAAYAAPANQDQKVREVLEICDRVYSIKLGKVAFAGKPEELKDNKAKLKELFL